MVASIISRSLLPSKILEGEISVGKSGLGEGLRD